MHVNLSSTSFIKKNNPTTHFYQVEIPNTTRTELFPLHLFYKIFFRTYTHTHTRTNTQMKQRTPSYVNYLRLHENQLAPTFLVLIGTGWIHLSSYCCPLLNLLVLTPAMFLLGKDLLCAYSFAFYPYLDLNSFGKGISESLTLSYSLFSHHRRSHICTICWCACYFCLHFR